MSENNENSQTQNNQFENVPFEIIDNPNDNFGIVITNILNNDAIQKIITKFADSKEKAEIVINKRETNFQEFLKHIDWVQKLYNVIYIILISIIIYFLTLAKVIDTKVAETILVFVIGLSTQNAITSFFNSKKKD